MVGGQNWSASEATQSLSNPAMLHNAFSPADAGSPDSVAPSVCGSSASTTPRCDPMPSHFGHIGAAKPAVGKATANRAMPAAKRQGNAGKMLPPPFTEALILQAISELPDGTRRATETCYQCFQVCKPMQVSQRLQGRLRRCGEFAFVVSQLIP